MKNKEERGEQDLRCKKVIGTLAQDASKTKSVDVGTCLSSSDISAHGDLQSSVDTVGLDSAAALDRGELTR
jgi:hypothetical protein